MADAAAVASERARSSRGEVLVSTKLNVPPARAGLVPRRQLVDLIIAGADRKLTLLDAPPGSGKTTLLTEWAAAPEEERPFAWVSLDTGDSDPVRFWDYVIEALRTVAPGIGEQASTALRTPNASFVDAALPLLVNELAALPRRVVLVLDDYHLASDWRIHQSIAFLVDHMPATVHLAIATRSDPPLALGRLRARQEMTEIRAAELRFTGDETAMLLNEVLELELDRGDITRLHERVEGWAAGLQLAALSLRNREDTRAFIDSFAGDDRQIVDYLFAEVLDNQAQEPRAFLLRTSILDRLSASLCDVVTGSLGSADLLEELERSNVFLVALDSRREWYRYHALFGEFLRYELARSEPALVADLHRRACRWHSEHGSVPEAINHAVLAGELGEASELITSHWYGFLQNGRLETVTGWLHALGDEAVGGDPNLCLVRAWTAVNTGRLDEVALWVGAAQRAIAGSDLADATILSSGVASLRAIHRYMSGDVGEAVEAGQRSRELEPGQTPWRPVGCPVLGISLYWSGRSDEAAEELRGALRTAEVDGNHLAEIHALGGLAAIEAEAGGLEEAELLARRASDLAEQHDLAEHWATTLARVVRGEALEQQGRVQEAHEAIDRGVELSRRGVASLEIAFALQSLAEARQLQGDAEGAREALERARLAVDRCADPGILTAMLVRTERKLRLGLRGTARGTGAGSDELSDRELAVLRLLPSKLSQREIGDALYVSINTVKTHLKSIYRKLDADSRTGAVARARELQLL